MRNSYFRNYVLKQKSRVSFPRYKMLKLKYNIAKQSVEMFQIKKIIKLNNEQRQQQKRPNSYKSNGFSTWSIYGFLLFFVLTKHGTNRRGRLASSAMWIIMALCIQSQDDILLQVINRNETRLLKTRIVIPLAYFT